MAKDAAGGALRRPPLGKRSTAYDVIRGVNLEGKTAVVTGGHASPHGLLSPKHTSVAPRHGTPVLLTSEPPRPQRRSSRHIDTTKLFSLEHAGCALEIIMVPHQHSASLSCAVILAKHRTAQQRKGSARA